MNIFKKKIIKLVEWFKLSYKIYYVDDSPEIVDKRTIYVVGQNQNTWLLAFECPCGCKTIIQLNILEDTKPNWRYTIGRNKKINITPSIWRTTGCKSHFFIKRGKILWC